jgi:hypothetical protein
VVEVKSSLLADIVQEADVDWWWEFSVVLAAAVMREF